MFIHSLGGYGQICMTHIKNCFIVLCACVAYLYGFSRFDFWKKKNAAFVALLLERFSVTSCFFCKRVPTTNIIVSSPAHVCPNKAGRTALFFHKNVPIRVSNRFTSQTQLYNNHNSFHISSKICDFLLY